MGFVGQTIASRPVSQRRVWPYLVVMLPPVFDYDLRLFQCVEDFAVEQLVAQLSIEAFAIAILPRASRLDVGSVGSDGCNPFSESNGDELRTVI